MFPWLFGWLVGGCCCSSTAHARIALGGPGHRFSVFLWVTNVLGWKFTVFDSWDSQALETRIASSIMSYFNLIQFHRIAWEKATGFLWFSFSAISTTKGLSLCVCTAGGIIPPTELLIWLNP